MKKWITKLLVCAILLNAVPLPLRAETPPMEEEKIPKTLIGEIKEKRKENEKHFLYSDNSIALALYPDAVHYLENGIYEEIDNGLIQGREEYSIKKNPTKIKFSKKANDKRIISIKNKEYTLNWGLEETNKVKLETTNETKESKDPFEVDTHNSTITYREVLPAIDLEYKITGKNIKENIILKEEKALNQKLIFNIEAKGLEFVKEDNHTILVQKGKETLFYIQAPYMYDKHGNYSDSLKLNVIETKKGNQIEVEIDKNWVKDKTYPIIIDPSITTSRDYQAINDTFIYNNDTNNPDKRYAHILRVGNNSLGYTGNKAFRTLLKFTLPSLKSGDQVINATLNLYNYPDTNEWNPPTTDIIVDVHAMTKNWNEANAFYKDLSNAYNTKIIDYFTYHYDPNNPTKRNTMDITSIVKDWYITGNNYGIMLKEHTEFVPTNRQDMYFLSANTDSIYYNGRPSVIITYRNQTGLEPYLTTHSISVNRAGTIYTNDYNGNTTFIHNDASTKGSRLPVSINHVYNTNDKDRNIGLGNGFRLNLNQTLSHQTIGDINYVRYIDEDATSHYFKREGTTYTDEDGLGLTLQLENDTYTMKDKEGNTSIFPKNGNIYRLTQIKDSSSNTIDITYTGDFITKVTDAAKESITLEYTDNLLSKITDSYNKSITYTYENNNLTKITYPDNQITTYEYQNNLLTKINNIDNRNIKLDYYPTSPYRIKKLTEYGSDNTLGQELNITYLHNTTTFENEKQRKEIYTFNDYGQTVSITTRSKDDINHSYGSSDAYQNEDKNQNRLSNTVPLHKTSNNLISNTSFETADDWWYYNDRTNGTCTTTTETTYIGSKAIKCTSTKESNGQPAYIETLNIKKGETYTLSAYIKTKDMKNGTGGAGIRLYYKDAAKKYRYKASEYIKVNQDWTRISTTIDYPSDASTPLNAVVYLNEFAGTAYFDNVQLEADSKTNTYNLISNSGFDLDKKSWKSENLETTDKVVTQNNNQVFLIKGNPTKRKNVYQSIPISGKKGDSFLMGVWYKDTGVPSNRPKESKITILYEGVDGKQYWDSQTLNPSADEWQYASKKTVAPADYKRMALYVCFYYNANTFYFDNLTLYKDIGTNSFIYDANGNVTDVTTNQQNQKFIYDKNNKLVQTLNPTGTDYIYERDYEKKDRILKSVDNTNLEYQFTYDDVGNQIEMKMQETDNIKEIESNKAYYIKTVPTNLYFSVTGDTNTSNVELGPLDNTGNQEFKIVRLENGNYQIKPNRTKNDMTISVKSNTDKANVELEKTSINSKAQEFIFTKNEDNTFSIKTMISNKTKVLDITSGLFENKRNVQQYTSNNSLAQKFILEPVTKPEKPYMESKQEWDETKAYVTKVIDPLGKVTKYTYDEAKNIKTIEDNNGNITSYTYDSLDRITKLQLNNHQNEYEYQLDRLQKIKHNGFSYQFTYNPFGELNQVKVNNQILVTNDYENRNGNLIKKTYGNHDTIEYTYDELDRLQKKITPNQTVEYTYDNFNNISSIKGEKTEYYTYDFASRLHSYQVDSFKETFSYNNKNQLSKKESIYQNNKNITNYTYSKENRIEKVDTIDSTINYTYDTLSRTNKTILKKADKTFETTYEYVTDGNKTSTLLKKINRNGDTITYEYDNNYNITKIAENDIIKEYEYDELNQLIKEDNHAQNITIKYTYDIGGNLLKKEYYQYKTENKIKTDTYLYQNDWKDQLTSYNNKTITYDEIGNPLTYDNNTYTWENGKTLKQIQTGSNTYTYKYNDSNIRTEKKKNDETIQYFLEGNNIIYEVRPNSVIYYRYDEKANVTGFHYQEKDYYYIKNAENDIIGILDENLQKIVSYSYDSWGNILSILDENNQQITDQNHIGNINPFRYRSYYYDEETNLYYLNSRYYNPEWGRFLNADSIINTTKNLTNINLYAYTDNNPISRMDTEGNLWWQVACGFFSGAANAITKMASNIMNNEEILSGTLSAFTSGFVNGVLLTTTFNPALASYVSANVEATMNEGAKYLSGEKGLNVESVSNSIRTITNETIVNGTIGAITGRFASNTIKTNRGWFQPQKIVTSFTGKYARRVIGQNIVQASSQIIINAALPNPQTNTNNPIQSDPINLIPQNNSWVNPWYTNYKGW